MFIIIACNYFEFWAGLAVSQYVLTYIRTSVTTYMIGLRTYYVALRTFLPSFVKIG